MLSLIALVAIKHAQDPPRLRTVLDNGAIILVEPRPASPTISLHLFASAKHVVETEANHGYRHLLEHLLARGPERDIDRTLETNGCFLTASTLRDAMHVELTLGKDQLDLGLKTLSILLRKPAFTQERIDKEVRIIRDEIAMQDDTSLLSTASWTAAYDKDGLDPLGDFDTLYRATPERLQEEYVDQFATDGLVVTVTGPVDLDGATKKIAEILAPRAKYLGKHLWSRVDGKPGQALSDGSGESRAALVPGYTSPQAMAALVAAFGIAADNQDCFVTYTPTIRNGLVIVGRTSRSSGIGEYVDGMKEPLGLFGIGKKLAISWVRRQLESDSGNGYLRGLLLAQGSAYRPETMIDEIENLSPAQFLSGFDRFKQDKAVVAVGSR